MNKQFLVAALVLAALESCGQVSFGAKGGMNINGIGASGLPGNVSNVYASDIGFHAGFFGQFQVSGKFSFSPELQFSKRGAAINNPSLPADLKLNLNYLELPLLASYSLFRKVTLDLGPCVAYQLSATLKTNSSTNSADNIYSQKMDFGLATGLKFHVTNKVSLVGRYYYGFTHVDQFSVQDAANHPTTVTNHNRTIQLGLSYRLKGGR